MAQKRITELVLRDDVDTDVNVPVDDGIQSYRTTATQWKDFILPDAGIARAKLGVGAIALGTIVSKANADSPYTQVVDTDLLLINGTSGVTVTMLAAASYTGKRVRIRKTDSTTGVVTITGVTTLNTQGETVHLFSDGSSWLIVDRHIPMTTTSVTMTTNMSTNGTVTANMIRIGDQCRIDYRVTYTGAANAVTFTMTLPTGIAIDTTKHGNSTALASTFGEGFWFDPAGGTTRYGTKAIFSTTSVFHVMYTAATGSFAHYSSITNTVPFTVANGTIHSGYVQFPVSGWAAS